MESRSIQKQDWQKTLDRIYLEEKSKPQRITIEVNSPDMGVQKEVENVEFQGISYDHKDDLVAVDTDNIEHMIRHPEKIEMAVSDGELVCLEVIDKDALRHLIYFTPPIKLPSSPAAGASAARA